MTRNLWALVTLGAMISLTGCDALSTDSNAGPSMAASPPALLMQARMVDQTQLRPVVSLTDATGDTINVPMQSLADNAWNGRITVTPNHQYSLEVVWVESYNNQDLELARYDETFSVDDQGQRINIAANEYNYELDTDGDGLFNLDERENQTDPFVNADTGESSLEQPTTNDGPDEGIADDVPNADSSEDLPGEDSSEDLPNADSSEDLPGEDSSEDLPGEDSSEDLPDTELIPDTQATVIIPRIARSDAPVIDGEDVAIDSNSSFTGEWASAVQFDQSGNSLTMSHLMVDNEADAPDGNNYRRWAAMHDGKYLYLLVVVDDDGRRQSDSDQFWKDDSLELFIDGDNSKLTSWDDSGDFHLIIPLQSAGATGKTKQRNVYVTGFNAQDNIPEIKIVTGPGLGPRGVRRPLYENDVYELRIELDSVSILPGRQFGFELQVNDDDDGQERDSKWGWFHPSLEGDEANDTTYLNPSVMGTVILE
ncbi:MAG: sugar-binding protein [Granulosicoccus sp.]